MKKVLVSVSVLALLSASLPACAGINHGVAAVSPANTYLVYSGCAQPPNTNPGTNYYVDAATGSDSNNGLAPGSGHAWATVTHAVATVPSAGGDTINVNTGSYGSLSLSRDLTAYTSIKAAPGQTPLFTSTSISGSKWLLQGLKYQALRGGSSNFSAFISMLTTGHDIVFYGNDFSSAPFSTVTGWTQTDWQNNAKWQAIALDEGGGGTRNIICVSIVHNTMEYLEIPISTNIDYLMVDSNIMDWDANDYIDIAGSNVQVSNNIGTNSIYDGAVPANHNDFVQGQIGRCFVTSCNYSNILVTGNTQIELNSPAASVPFTTYNGVTQQGLSFFDEDWTNVTITNNILINSSNWGVGAQSFHNAVIANNTAINVGTNSTTSGIQVSDTSHEGSSSNDVEVFNNIASYLGDDAATATLHFYNNLVTKRIGWFVTGSLQFITAPGTYTSPPVTPNINNVITATALTGIFQTFDSSIPSYDMHLITGSPAIGAGTATGAPNKVDGTPRTGTVDLGAY